MVKSNSKVFEARKEEWSKAIADTQEQEAGTRSKIDKAAKLVEQNDDDLKMDIENLVSAVQAERRKSTATVVALLANTETIVAIDSDRDKYTSRINGHFRTIANSTTSVTRRAERAKTDWPEKIADLTKRMAVIDAIKQQAASLQKSSAKALSADNADPLVIFDVHKKSESLASQCQKFNEDLGNCVGQLYVSWDKVLVDMEIKEKSSTHYDWAEEENVTNVDSKFYHKYKTITISITDPSTKTGTHTSKEKWVPVPSKTYSSYEDKLGMTVVSKPAGKYDHEVSKVAPPPGYSYMAKPGQSNQYGHWNTDRSGNSFWAFYGQYAFMRSMFWGSSYQPIYVNDYRGYRSAYSSGRPYYGRTTTGQQRYGTKGTTTATKYKASKYTRSGGYASTTYKKSGGYNSSGYRSGRGGSYRSGGSRSGGGK